ncbi:hypothetical protein KQY30_33725 [Streptomyces sp. GMY02]|uniref:hypothetical protein n=1 Tax=Streptomyces sp. GMY02 TaxID=1333528 RepID=UPI001C2C8208|nr:hypothetical protein [Streptomyces sp. GMY02]QXE38457.1 hypothetical protein KQY30_33725 [Streptomyces sp. GMY02]
MRPRWAYGSIALTATTAPPGYPAAAALLLKGSSYGVGKLPAVSRHGCRTCRHPTPADLA